MRIDGPSNQPKVPTNQKNSALVKEKSGQITRAGDSVELSGGPTDLASLSDIAKQGDQVRTSRVEEVRTRLSSGYYNTEEFRNDLAEAVLSKGVVDEVVADSIHAQEIRRQVDEVPEIRSDRVENAKSRVSDGFYSREQTKLDTADSIIDELI